MTPVPPLPHGRSGLPPALPFSRILDLVEEGRGGLSWRWRVAGLLLALAGSLLFLPESPGGGGRQEIEGRPVSLAPWPKGVKSETWPLQEASVRLPSGEMLRRVVLRAFGEEAFRSAAIPVLQGQSPFSPPTLAIFPWSFGQLLCFITFFGAFLFWGGTFLRRFQREKWRIRLLKEGRPGRARVVHFHQDRLMDGERPVGFRVDVSWEEEDGAGRARASSVEDFHLRRAVCFPPGGSIPILKDPASGRSLPCHLLESFPEALHR